MNETFEHYTFTNPFREWLKRHKPDLEQRLFLNNINEGSLVRGPSRCRLSFNVLYAEWADCDDLDRYVCDNRAGVILPAPPELLEGNLCPAGAKFPKLEDGEAFQCDPKLLLHMSQATLAPHVPETTVRLAIGRVVHRHAFLVWLEIASLEINMLFDKDELGCWGACAVWELKP